MSGPDLHVTAAAQGGYCQGRCWIGTLDAGDGAVIVPLPARGSALRRLALELHQACVQQVAKERGLARRQDQDAEVPGGGPEGGAVRPARWEATYRVYGRQFGAGPAWPAMSYVSRFDPPVTDAGGVVHKALGQEADPAGQFAKSAAEDVASLGARRPVDVHMELHWLPNGGFCAFHLEPDLARGDGELPHRDVPRGERFARMLRHLCFSMIGNEPPDSGGGVAGAGQPRPGGGPEGLS